MSPFQSAFNVYFLFVFQASFISVFILVLVFLHALVHAELQATFNSSGSAIMISYKLAESFTAIAKPQAVILAWAENLMSNDP